MKLNNKYYILRHGEALSNVKNIVSCWPEKFKNPLTRLGKEQVKESAEKLKNLTEQAGKGIDLIFSSDMLRTKQTAQIVGKALKVNPEFDKRLREYNVGVFNGRPVMDFTEFLTNNLIRFNKKSKGGETYSDIINRTFEFLKDIDKKYENKNILIVSHQVPLTLLLAKVYGLSLQEIFKKYFTEGRIKTSEIRELN